MALYNMWAHAACFWISELFHPIMFAMPLALFIMGRHTGSFYESAKLLAPSKAIFRGIPTSPVRRLAVPALCLGAFTSTGDFEVEVEGTLVHSKKGGAGFP